MKSSARGTSPTVSGLGVSSAGPVIVYVFPDPVCPKANTVVAYLHVENKRISNKNM